MTPERFAGVAGLAFGLLLCALTPPFGAPDEPGHLFRAWSIAHGEWIVRGGGAFVPQSYVSLAAASLRDIRGTDAVRMQPRTLRALAAIPLQPQRLIFVTVPPDSSAHPLAYTAPSYTPIGYLPTAAAIAICRALHAPPLVHLYAARVANVIVATLLLVVAIARAPFGKWTLTLSSLIPMAVYTRASVSIDGLTVAAAYLLIAEFLRLAVDRGGTFVLALESFVLAAIKPGYALLPFAAIRRRTAAAILAGTAAGVVVSSIWAAAAGNAAGGGPIDPHARLLAMTHHPATFIAALAADWQQSLGIRIVETVGVFGWLDAPIPLAFAIVYLSTMALVASLDGSPSRSVSGSRRLWIVAIFAATIVAITVTTHLFAPPGRFALFQGRYLLPVLPLPFLALATRRSSAYVPALCAGITGLAIIQTIWIELQRFYL